MTRKHLDCRDHPSVSGCTLAMSGEESELLDAAAAHAVSVHGHTDDAELRAGVREDMHDEPVADTTPGGFIQLIEFRTDRIDEFMDTAAEWVAAIGADRTARWELTAVDRDHPNTYVQIVEFPNYEAAMRNSKHPATARFADRLAKLCDGPARFTNLDLRDATTF